MLCVVGAFGSVPLLCFSVRRLAFPFPSPYSRVPCACAVPCLPSRAVQPLPQPRVPPLVPPAYYAFHCERPHFHRAFERPSLRRRVPAARYVPHPVAQPTPYASLRLIIARLRPRPLARLPPSPPSSLLCFCLAVFASRALLLPPLPLVARAFSPVLTLSPHSCYADLCRAAPSGGTLTNNKL